MSSEYITHVALNLGVEVSVNFPGSQTRAGPMNTCMTMEASNFRFVVAASQQENNMVLPYMTPVIDFPHLLVRATIERRVSTLVATSGSHWLK
jgi:hypothetical protein